MIEKRFPKIAVIIDLVNSHQADEIVAPLI